jgi:PAS domain S-box-containing protein
MAKEPFKSSLFSFLGKLVSRAARCKAPPTIEVKLPDQHRKLAAVTRECLHSEAFFRAMTENSWEVVALLDPDTRIHYVTESVKRVIGYRPEEITGTLGIDLVYQADRQHILDLYEQVVLNIRPITVERFRLVTKSGELRWVQCTGKNLLSNPAIGGVAIYYHDITSTMATKREARRSRERLQLALKAAQMGTFDWDLISGKSYWSNKTEELYGFEPGEFKGTLAEIRSRIPEEEYQRNKPMVDKALFEGTEYAIEYRIHLPNGTERWVMNRGLPQKNGEGKLSRVVGVVMDITELKQNEMRLRAASEAKSQFMANMSHEIRTPLGAILGFAELMRDRGISHEDRMHYAEIVHHNGQQLATVINDILDLSKVEAGKLDIHVSVFSLASLVAEIASFLRPLAVEKNVELKIDPVPPDIPGRVKSDPARVKQVLTNVIGNAIKFTQTGGEIRLSLSFKKSNEHNCACVEIKDTGIGIEEIHRQNIFAPFYQADASRSRQFGGTGLGLSLSRHLARLLGGDLILVESTPGKGSTFRFTFDLNLGPAAAARPQVKADEKVSTIEGARVLLAEDSPDNQLLISHFLSSAGARVDAVDNGQQAVEKALQGHYDIVFMDIQMPVLDGYKATQILRSRGYTGRIVALTAHAMMDERAHSFEVGCDDHLTKPVNRAELIEAVARH